MQSYPKSLVINRNLKTFEEAKFFSPSSVVVVYNAEYKYLPLVEVGRHYLIASDGERESVLIIEL